MEHFEVQLVALVHEFVVQLFEGATFLAVLKLYCHARGAGGGSSFPLQCTQGKLDVLHGGGNRGSDVLRRASEARSRRGQRCAA